MICTSSTKRHTWLGVFFFKKTTTKKKQGRLTFSRTTRVMSWGSTSQISTGPHAATVTGNRLMPQQHPPGSWPKEHRTGIY